MRRSVEHRLRLASRPLITATAPEESEVFSVSTATLASANCAMILN